MSARLKDLAGSSIQQREPILGPIWLKARFAYNMFGAASTTSNPVTAFVIPPKCVVHGVFVKHSVPFTGGSITAAVVNIGNAGNNNAYTSAFNVYSAVADTNFSLNAPLQVLMSTLVPSNTLIAVTTTGANTSALTAGNLEVGLLVSEIP